MSQTEQRAEGRVKALLRARLSGYGFERDACVLNLSPQGLLVTTAIPPRCSTVVTVIANGHAMTGEVKWVSERRFGIVLDEAINIGEVSEERIRNPEVRQATKSLPENFGIRPQQASAALTLTQMFESQWVRYAAIALVGGGMAIYAGMFAGHHAGKMADQMDTVHEASQAESRAMGK